MGVVKSTVYYSIGEICPRILSFLLLPIFTRYLSTSDYGILSYTNSISTLLLVLGIMSLNSYVLRYFFIYKTDVERRRMIGTIYCFIGLTNVLLFSLIYLSGPYLLSEFDIQIPWNPYFKYALIINLLDSFSVIPLAVYRVKQQPLNFVALSFGRTLCVALLNIYFIVYAKTGLVGYYHSMLYVYIPFFFIYLYIISKNAEFCLRKEDVCTGLKYALPLLPGALSYIVLSTFDRVILERYVALSIIGIYNIAYTLSFALNVVNQSVYKAIEPEIFKRYGTPDYEQFLSQAKRVFFPLLYLVGMGITLFSQEFFFFITSKDFYEGYKLVPFLICTAVLSGQNVLYSNVLGAERRTKVSGGITIAGGICSFTLNMILIPVMGVWGAAISSVTSFAFMNFLLYKNVNLQRKSVIREYVSLLVLLFIPCLLSLFDMDISFFTAGLKAVIVVAFSIYLLALYGWHKQDVVSLCQSYFNMRKRS